MSATIIDGLRLQSGICPDKIAIRSLISGENLSFTVLDKMVDQYAGYLCQALPKPGARIALLARNSPLYAVLFYACARAGMIFVPLNWRLTSTEIAQSLTVADPEIMIFSPEFAHVAVNAITGQKRPALMALEKFQACIAASSEMIAPDMDPDAVFTLLFTSGTTGKQKCAGRTLRNAICEAANFSELAGVDGSSTLLINIPLFHTAGLFAQMNTAISTGATLLMTDRFLPDEALEQLSDPRLCVTHYFCVPQMAQAMVNDAAYIKGKLSGLHSLVIGGAPTPTWLTKKLLADGVTVLNGYGMSEAGSVLGMPFDTKKSHTKTNSVGLPAPFIDIKLVDSNGTEVPKGQTGEVYLRGAGVITQYWREADAKSFKDGWLRTGDMARQDEDGFFYIAGRFKDIYIMYGENVYPAEVESVLCELEGIKDAAVLGVPDTELGESGCAFLVADKSAQIDCKTVLHHCNTLLARYKHPAHIHFVDAIPRNASGKILKSVLREHYLGGVAINGQ